MAVTAFLYPMIFHTTWSKEAALTVDTMKVALSNTAYVYAATHKYFDAAPFNAAWTELGTANGYTAGGVSLTAPAITDGQTTSWSASSAVWTGAGAGLSATSAVIYDGSPGAGLKPLIGYILFGGTVTAAVGATLTITPNASGYMSVVVA